eukprot:5432641-Alexandrium_andersonii.AAC.1
MARRAGRTGRADTHEFGPAKITESPHRGPRNGRPASSRRRLRAANSPPLVERAGGGLLPPRHMGAS